MVLNTYNSFFLQYRNTAIKNENWFDSVVQQFTYSVEQSKNMGIGNNSSTGSLKPFG